MTKQTIAVDIDNVLAKHAEALMSFYNSVSGKRLTVEDYSEDWRWVGGNVNDIKHFGKQFVESGLHAQLEATPGAFQALNKLKSDYKLVVITARLKPVMDMTQKWIAKHFPGIFDTVHYANIWEEGAKKITKADICRQVGADYLIDDSLDHCMAVAEADIQTLLFGNYRWNQTQQKLPNKVKKVANWQEVLDYFDARN